MLFTLEPRVAKTGKEGGRRRRAVSQAPGGGGHSSKVRGTCMRTPNSSAQLTEMRAWTRPWRLKKVRSVPVDGCV